MALSIQLWIKCNSKELFGKIKKQIIYGNYLLASVINNKLL